jgi:hypothetical protein
LSLPDDIGKTFALEKDFKPFLPPHPIGDAVCLETSWCLPTPLLADQTLILPSFPQNRPGV